MAPVRLLLIDDHSLIRAGARMLIRERIADAIVEEADSIAAALDERRERPSLVVLDVRLNAASGHEGLPLIRQRWPDVPVVMLASHPDPEAIHVASARGASAMLSKSDAASGIVSAIERLLPRPRHIAAATDHVMARELLTPRQHEVLDHLCRGLTNKAIASSLGISEFTVRRHVHDVIDAFGVSSRSEAVFAARCRGIVN